MLYLAFLCPYALVEDEAQYWEWSRHLSLSYYTKGPGIAWTIAAATALLGDSAFAVRASAPLFSALASLALAALILDLTGGDRRKTLYAVGAFQLAPINLATALLGTIDGPYCACWAIACLGAWRALARPGGRRWWWPLVGAAIGVGFLYKYTILLLIPGLLAFALLRPRDPDAKSPSPAPHLLVAGVLFALAISPVIIWNQQHAWPTLGHLLGHLGFAEHAAAPLSPAPNSPAQPSHWSPLWSIEFLFTQVGLAGPALALALIGVARAWRDRASRSAQAQGELFLACAGLPILAFYLLVSFIAEPEGNWPMAAYVTLLPLAGLVAADAMRQHRLALAAWFALPPPRPRAGFLRARPESVPQVLWHLTLAVGLIGGVLMLRADLLGRLPGLDSVIPRARLAQGELLASGVQVLRERARAAPPAGFQGDPDPILIVAHYGRASQLAFYLPDRPVVMCASSRIGGRPTQHDYWPSHDLDRPQLRARTALLIGGEESTWAAAFDRLEPLGLVPGVERKNIRAFLGVGYRGF